MAPDYPWWRTGTIYQIYPRSFADGNGDGVGDLGGITSRINYLAETLGVDAIWLSPFYPSPQDDFGYDVTDYCDVDPIYGTLEDFDRLVMEAHARGMKVIVDYVINHTSDCHPWFIESRSSIDNPKRDWYVWRDRPNNWLSLFGGSAWEQDAATGQHYLHSFLASQPDLNWRNPEVESAMFDVLRFWMERGVDGFRIDVAHFSMKDPLLRDNPLASRAPADAFKLTPERATQIPLHSQAHPDIHALFRRLRAVVDDYLDLFTVGEIHEFDWSVWARYYGRLDELHMPFNFTLLPAGADPIAIRAAIRGLESSLPDGAWPNWVAGNHDEPRIATRLGWEQSQAMAVILLTLRGTPTLYYGDEIGMEELDIPPARQQDPWGRRNPGYGRDGCRTPMQWSPDQHAGFSTSPGPCWLPVHPAAADRNVAAELGDPASHLELYRRLLRLRRLQPALHLGDVEVLEGPEAILSYRRSHSDSEAFTIHANLSGSSREIAAGGLVAISTDHNREGSPFDGTLAPWEAVIATG
ncbi:MAG TPA: alpha-amylase family glycosyl hydrolase [Acidimicrobiia bacterium]|nr:alpha-amylase family glycosyl hydrolase [Acidimicrobiia bacterium]